jgi:hypothetical protein
MKPRSSKLKNLILNLKKNFFYFKKGHLSYYLDNKLYIIGGVDNNENDFIIFDVKNHAATPIFCFSPKLENFSYFDIVTNNIQEIYCFGSEKKKIKHEKIKIIENDEKDFEIKKRNEIFKYSVENKSWELINFISNLEPISNHQCFSFKFDVYFLDSFTKNKKSNVYCVKNIVSSCKQVSFILYLENLFNTHEYFDLILKVCDVDVLFFF